MLMRTSTHHKMVEADTLKIAEQGSVIRKLTAERDAAKERAEKVFRANLQLALECEQLRMRLEPFIAPRERDEKGRFQPVKSTIDHMLDALETL